MKTRNIIITVALVAIAAIVAVLAFRPDAAQPLLAAAGAGGSGGGGSRGEIVTAATVEDAPEGQISVYTDERLVDEIDTYILGQQDIEAVGGAAILDKNSDKVGLIQARNDEGVVVATALSAKVSGLETVPVLVDFRSTAFTLLATSPEFLTSNVLSVLALRGAAEKTEQLGILAGLLAEHAVSDPNYLSNPTQAEGESLIELINEVNGVLVEETASLPDGEVGVEQVVSGSVLPDALLANPISQSDECSEDFDRPQQSSEEWTGVCAGPSKFEGSTEFVNHSTSWVLLFSEGGDLPVGAIPPATITKSEAGKYALKFGKALPGVVQDATILAAICTGALSMGVSCKNLGDRTYDVFAPLIALTPEPSVFPRTTLTIEAKADIETAVMIVGGGDKTGLDNVAEDSEDVVRAMNVITSLLQPTLEILLDVTVEALTPEQVTARALFAFDMISPTISSGETGALIDQVLNGEPAEVMVASGDLIVAAVTDTDFLMGALGLTALDATFGFDSVQMHMSVKTVSCLSKNSGTICKAAIKKTLEFAIKKVTKTVAVVVVPAVIPGPGWLFLVIKIAIFAGQTIPKLLDGISKTIGLAHSFMQYDRRELIGFEPLDPFASLKDVNWDTQQYVSQDTDLADSFSIDEWDSMMNRDMDLVGTAYGMVGDEPGAVVLLHEGPGSEYTGNSRENFFLHEFVWREGKLVPIAASSMSAPIETYMSTQFDPTYSSEYVVIENMSVGIEDGEVVAYASLVVAGDDNVSQPYRVLLEEDEADPGLMGGTVALLGSDDYDGFPGWSIEDHQFSEDPGTLGSGESLVSFSR